MCLQCSSVPIQFTESLFFYIAGETDKSSKVVDPSKTESLTTPAKEVVQTTEEDATKQMSSNDQQQTGGSPLADAVHPPQQSSPVGSTLPDSTQSDSNKSKLEVDSSELQSDLNQSAPVGAKSNPSPPSSNQSTSGLSEKPTPTDHHPQVPSTTSTTQSPANTTTTTAAASVGNTNANATTTTKAPLPTSVVPTILDVNASPKRTDVSGPEATNSPPFEEEDDEDGFYKEGEDSEETTAYVRGGGEDSGTDGLLSMEDDQDDALTNLDADDEEYDPSNKILLPHLPSVPKKFDDPLQDATIYTNPDEDTHFFVHLVIIAFLVAIVYITYHNKRKVSVLTKTVYTETGCIFNSSD